MSTKKNIALIAGGYSSEYDVSINSAQNIYTAIDDTKYNRYLAVITKDKWEVHYNNEKYPIDKNDFSFYLENEKINFDFAYITIHGTPGENGLLQGYLAMLDIPHSTCDTFTASLTFDKFACNRYLQSFGIKIAESLLVKSREQYTLDEINERIGTPCFVKPNSDGSSFGISKVNTKDGLKNALDKAFSYCNEVIIEKAINGLEFTCGAVKTSKEEIILPVTEIIPRNEFFDFEAKYDATMAEEITPARISKELTEFLKEQTSRIYDILKCKGIIRIDYIIENNIVYVLEVNTTPGMTSNSFIPKQVKASGRDLKDIIGLIIEDYSI